MKPPTPPSSIPAGNGKDETALLQAARAMDEAQPGAALDAAILSAAAERAAQVRKARVNAAPAPARPQRSMFRRALRWLLGQDQQGWRFGPMTAAAVLAAFTTLLILQTGREDLSAPTFALGAEDVRASAAPAAPRAQAVNPAPAAESAPPPPAAASESAAAVAPPPAAAPTQADMQSAAPAAARSAPPSSAARQVPIKQIDASLKRIFELHGAGKSEQAHQLLRELRARHPGADLEAHARRLYPTLKDLPPFWHQP
jgi:hypothetical protein